MEFGFNLKMFIELVDLNPHGQGGEGDLQVLKASNISMYSVYVLGGRLFANTSTRENIYLHYCACAWHFHTSTLITR
jgi:hypothetical protein